ncbi:MAG TPA: ABC transporter ATP-binding protein [Actinomycetota bacterium]|nr:ABC transporter ATP-binding protein [Actinomycetota bacterium]
MDAPAIRATGLTKQFGARTAFRDLTFEVGTGEVFGFLGPNGAGKTTTVRVLGTLIRPTAGSAEVAGVALGEGSGQELRRLVAVMPENPGMYLRLTVYDNLEYFAGLYGVPRAQVRERILSSLDTVGMAGRVNDFAGSLSKGLRQRASLARTLLSNPRVLFLDEPTSGLDPVATREVRELIEGLRTSGVTVFLTTHRLDEAERLCDRIAVLNTTLRVVGRPDDLRRQLFQSAVEVRTRTPLQDPAALFGSIAEVDGWSPDGDGAYHVRAKDLDTLTPKLTRALVAAGADVLRIAEVERTLEDVYLQLVDEDVEVQR